MTTTPASPITLAILINSFNRVELFREAIAALRRWLPGDENWRDRAAVVIYDAGSTDGTVEWLEREGNTFGFRVDLIQPRSPREDTSFAAGLNRIADYSIREFPQLEHLLFYETDNQILTADPINRARKVLDENEEVAACGFTVRYVTGAPAGIGAPFPTVGKFLLGPKVVHYLDIDATPYNRPEAFADREFGLLDVVYTSPLLVKTAAWRSSGGLDAATFPFSDCDLDWARNLRNLGWRQAVIPAQDVIHDNQAALSAWSANRALQFHRGRYRYLKKHAGNRLWLAWPVGLMARHALEWLAANLIYLGKPERRRRIRATAGKLFTHCLRGYER